ncbi:MAG: hypothetical protein ACXAC2_19105, partial [Candidatus Kariarchaeaceae archaeon]
MSNVSLFKTEYTTTENIERISRNREEPEWLLNRRKKAFDKFLDLPYDQDTLFYKYTNFRKLSPEKLTPMWELENVVDFPENGTEPTSVEFDNSIKVKL